MTIDFLPDVPSEPDRIIAMGRDEIRACTDIRQLADCEDEYMARAIALETKLQYRDGHDIDWYTRARGALIAFRIAHRRVEQRIKQLRRESRIA